MNLNNLKVRYTRPIQTPKDYESFENDISLWNAKDKDIGEDDTRHNRSTTGRPFMITNTFNFTHAFAHNMTINERIEFKTDLENYGQNSTNLWMKNITVSTTQDEESEDKDMFVTVDDQNIYHIPEYKPYRKRQRHKRG